MRDSLEAAIHDSIASLINDGELPADAVADSIELERPRVAEHGDWSTNIALTLARPARMAPRKIAELISGEIELPDGVTDVSVEGPGFVNFRLAESAWSRVIATVIEAGSAFGEGQVGDSAKVNFEYVSANPTGPMHLGHARWAAWGDALGRLLSASGYDVTREFYVNDAGNQLALFGGSLGARYLQACGRDVALPEDGYQGDYLVDLADDLKSEVGEMWSDLDPTDLNDRCGAWGCEKIIRQIEEQLNRLGVEFDVWFSEAEMRASGAVEKALEDLERLGKLYDEDGATWLRSTDYGDDKDRVLVKSDGSLTYLAGDIAYHRDKFARGFDLLIDLWGADHGGHVPKMRAALEALGYDTSRFEVILGQLVSLNRGGEPVRMSKRSGDIFSYEELVDEIGPDAARFHFLMQGPDSALNLDLDAIVRQSMDNPVFYVQMAHARICSIQRKAADASIDRLPVDSVELEQLIAPEELALLKKLDSYPETVAEATERRAPQRLTQWARELAGDFHSFYQEHRVIDGPGDMVQPRLWLIEACRIGLGNCLAVLGVAAPEAMERIEVEGE